LRSKLLGTLVAEWLHRDSEEACFEVLRVYSIPRGEVRRGWIDLLFST